MEKQLKNKLDYERKLKDIDDRYKKAMEDIEEKR